MAKERWLAGWTRIGETDFKAMAVAAIKADPGVRQRLQEALSIHGRQSGVPGETILRYLRWLEEVE